MKKRAKYNKYNNRLAAKELLWKPSKSHDNLFRNLIVDTSEKILRRRAAAYTRSRQIQNWLYGSGFMIVGRYVQTECVSCQR